jgi:L-asparaginase II
MHKQNPILVDVVRNGVVESFHRGSVIVVNTKGETVFSLGDIDRSIYPRSALKPLQAIPIIESGAADKFGLSDKEVSLSCASHNSEEIHVDTVNKWLERLQLNNTQLECGEAFPSYPKAAYKMAAAGEQPSRAHHNCSGKHSGMLTLASHLLDDVQGYSAHSHIVQQVWMNTLTEMIGEDVSKMHWEQDGCGLPAICMPIQKLAYAFSLFSEPDKQPGARGLAMTSILKSIAKYPEMIAGSERCCSAVAKETQGKVIVKYGAESVYAGVIPHLKLGFALKIDDGTPRGSEVALGALLNKVNAITAAQNEQLQPFFNPDIINSLKNKTGEIRASNVW